MTLRPAERRPRVILQTTFIKACEALPSFDGASGLRSWIYCIATNEGLMLLRRRKPQAPLEEIAEALQPDELPQQRQAWAPDPLRAALNGELHAELVLAIVALPEPLRVVVELRGIEQLSTEETAECLGLSEGAVKVRLHRARLKLREALSAHLTSPTETEDE